MPLHVIGLISGGKDSFYALAHCLRNGHKLIALANLCPRATVEDGQPDGEGEDINSFMYQTVGHSVVPLYADALELPLYRRTISGSAIQTGRYYDTSSPSTAVDETEDLYALVREVLEHHPEADALCSGAVLSTYQRTRVESVAVRHGLTPLSYLWQYPALPPSPNTADSLTSLLDDMDAAGCDARIIKIASGGINDSLIFSDVTKGGNKSRIVSGLTPFFEGHEFWLRGAVIGEGGEYETIALNGPRSLWKKRLDVLTAGFQRGDGGTLYAVLQSAALVPHQEHATEDSDVIRVPHLLDVRFGAMMQRTRSACNLDSPAARASTTSKTQVSLPTASHHHTTTTLSINNLTALDPNRTDTQPQLDCTALTASDQLRTIITDLRWYLQSLKPGLTPSSIVHATLILRDMSIFSAINPIYASIWPRGLPNPPARVTIAAPLPDGIEVALSLILDLGSREARKGLHVQSRSYWAPANIGPYSQAVSTHLFLSSDVQQANVHDAVSPEVVHMAGQIPLVPQTMELYNATNFGDQAVLALQHLWRVAQERGVDFWPFGVAYLEKRDVEICERARMVAVAWTESHVTDERGRRREEVPTESSADGKSDELEDEQTEFDIWDLRGNRNYGMPQVKMTVGEHLHRLPNYDILVHIPPSAQPGTGTPFVPPLIVAEVQTLPRNAPVEWWSTGVAGIPADTPSSQLNYFGGVLDKTLIYDGLVIEYSRHSNSQDDYKDHMEGSQPEIAVFLTVLVDDTAISFAPGDSFQAMTPGQLLTRVVPRDHRLNDKLSGDASVVSSQSFINTQSANATVVMTSKIAAASSTILCHSVQGMTSQGHHLSTSSATPIMNNLTAAIILRFEIN